MRAGEERLDHRHLLRRRGIRRERVDQRRLRHVDVQHGVAVRFVRERKRERLADRAQTAGLDRRAAGRRRLGRDTQLAHVGKRVDRITSFADRCGDRLR